MKTNPPIDASKTNPIKPNFHGFLIAVHGTASYNTIEEKDFLKSE
jgi:hypothetical protein